MATDSALSTLAVLGLGLGLAWGIAKTSRPDLVVTVNNVPTETGEAMDPADITLSTGYHSVTRISALEWLVDLDDGTHFVTYSATNPFLYIKQRNV